MASPPSLSLAGPDELLHVDSVAAAVLALVVRVLVEHDPAARTVGGPQLLGPPNRLSTVVTGPDWEVVVVTASSSS